MSYRLYTLSTLNFASALVAELFISMSFDFPLSAQYIYSDLKVRLGVMLRLS